MTIQSDLDKGTTLGDADGPDKFIESLGCTVPTFIDPRDDLVPDHAKGKFKRLNYHVPFKLRGEYKTEWLPPSYLNFYSSAILADIQGFALCGGVTRDGEKCKKRAVNRSMWCRNHGGALHPADKKMSGQSLGPVDVNRVAKLDRTQKFMQGLLKPEELDDDEVAGQFVRNSDGVPISAGQLGYRFQGMLAKELHSRLNQFLRSETPNMLKIVAEIAKSDLVEAGDRLKAAFWVAERTMGKTPDVLIHSQTDKPYESIFEQIETSSRDQYRAIESGVDVEDASIIDAESFEYGQDDDYSDSVVDEGQGDSGSNGDRVADDSNQSQRWSNVADDASNADHGIGAGIPVHDPAGYANEILEKRKEAKALRDRIQAAKRRRIVARAQGVGLRGDIAFAIRYRKHGNRFKAILVAPHQQTQRDLDKIG